MKKSLLLTLAALSVGSMAQAEDNFAKVYENAAIQYISPNGQYAAGSTMSLPPLPRLLSLPKVSML